MTDPHEDLVEAVARRLVYEYEISDGFNEHQARRASEGDMWRNFKAPARSVIALIADWRKRGEARDLLEKELDALSASHKDLAHRVARMGETLKNSREWLDASLMLVRGEGPPNWDGIRDAIEQIDAVLAPKP